MKGIMDGWMDWWLDGWVVRMSFLENDTFISWASRRAGRELGEQTALYGGKYTQIQRHHTSGFNSTMPFLFIYIKKHIHSVDRWMDGVSVASDEWHRILLAF